MNIVSSISKEEEYDIRRESESYFVATSKTTRELLKVYKIKLCEVKRTTNRENILKKLITYKGLHLLPCLVPLRNIYLAIDTILIEQKISENETLASEIESCAKYGICISEASIKMWLAQVVMALNALHKRNVIHSRVRSTNIYMEENKNFIRLGPTEEFLSMHTPPNVLNHDISVFKTRLAPMREKSAKFRENGRDMETIHYIAPELLNLQNDVDFCNDIWSLGIVVYNLTTLNSPYSGNCPIEITMALESQPIDFGKVKRRGYSSHLIKLMEQMLCKDPVKRISASRLARNPYLPSRMHYGL